MKEYHKAHPNQEVPKFASLSKETNFNKLPSGTQIERWKPAPPSQPRFEVRSMPRMLTIQRGPTGFSDVTLDTCATLDLQS